MRRVGLALAALVIFVILVSGCIDKLSTEERLLCIDLTSKSYAYIPKCTTQNDCFSKVEESFFHFNTENIPSSTAQELYYFKNHVALSWLYYNKSLNNISKINEICSSNSNHEQILTQLNELNFNLTKAFEESDNVHKKSFSILLLEKINLENESIEEIKEEPLYDYYILLNTNTNELSTLETEKTNSYVSFYFQQIEKFETLTQTTGFQKITASSYTPIDFIETYNKSVLDQIPDTVFYIPLIKTAISSSFSFLSDATKTRTAVSLLSAYPSFEFIQSYNDFMGTENSSVKKFAELISKGQSYRQNLTESNTQIHSKIEKNLGEIEIKVNSLSEMQDFDADFFSEIYALLGQNSEISTQKYSISDFSDAKSLAYDEYLRLSSKHAELQNAKNLNSITLGEETLELKSLLTGTSSLIENLNYLDSEILDGLHILCNERITLIESELSSTQIPANLILKITDLKTRLNYKINLFKKQTKNEKLKNCKSISEDYENFKIALLNFEDYETNTELKLTECTTYLDSVFESYKLLISEDFDLDDLYTQYKKFKSIPQPYSHIDSVTASCESIKNSLNSSLNSNQKLKSLTENYSIANQNLLKLTSLYSHYSEFSNTTSLKQLQKQFDSIESYFPESAPNFSKILPVINELNENIFSLISDCESNLKTFTISYIQKNFQLETFSDSIPNANELFETRTKIILQNPFFEINSPVEFQLPTTLEFSELISKSTNVLNVKSEKSKITLDLQKIPKGITFFEVLSKSLIQTSEKTELLVVSEQTAIIQKTISLETTSNHPKIKITSNLMPDVFKISDIFVTSSEKEVNFWMEKNNVFFFLENPLKKAQIYFSVADPIQKEVKLISKSQKNDLSSLYEYEIKVKNQLPFEISKITLSFPVNTDSKLLQNADLSTLEGKHIDFKTLPNGNIEATIQAIKPGQLGILHLTIIVEDSSQYWTDFLEKIKNALSLLKNSENQELSSEINSLLNELSNFEENFFQDKTKIERLTQISEKLSLLKSKNQESAQKIFQYTSLKNSISLEIETLKNYVSKFNEFGFTDYANTLSQTQQTIYSKLNTAEQLFSESKYDSAITILFEIRSLLSESSPPELPAILLSEKSELFQKYSLLSELAEKYQLSDLTNSKKDQLSLSDSKISELISSENYIGAKQELALLNTELSDFETEVSSGLKSKSELIKSNIDALSLASFSELKTKIEILSSFFEDVSEEELISAQYIPPINQKRLEKLSLKLDSLISTDLRAKFDNFSSLHNQQKYSEALSQAELFSDVLDAKLSERTALSSEITNAYDSIKEQAVVSFNSAVKLFEDSDFNLEAQQKLELAESSLENNQFLKSIVLSSSATGLISASKFQIPEIPVAVYPIILAAVIILTLRFRKKKQSENQKIRTQKVLRNW
ncbi:MAG: hypothetical protein V1672_02920 [Candidatus Diapherotrites archaeon]